MTELAGIFSSGMVLQRDKECAIWGKETEQSTVQVLFEDKVYDAEVTDGKFLVKLAAHEAATDCRIEVSGSSKIVLEDVCFGDVYYLSGQSNMELPVYRTRDISAEEIDASDYPYVRQYRVTPQFQICSENPPELPKLSWTPASGEKLAEMSAVGFFSAKRLYDAHKVPIGLVLAAQGGSTIEAWMPSELLTEFGDFEKTYAPFSGDGVLANYLKEQEANNASWRKALESEDDVTYPKAIPDGAEDVTFPDILLEKDGRGYVGIVWCYKEFELQQEPVEDAFLYLGDLIDADQSFVNGQLVGKTEYRYPPRKYPFDGRILKKGRNLICVRLLIEWGDGGFVAEHPYYIRCGSETVELSGNWKLVYGKKSAEPSLPGLRGQVIPTALFETSVRPLKNLTFKGIWWYQGESNCGDPSRYNEKFSSMVSYWRKWFGEDLPIICVEMCDYSDPITGEQPEFWAAIQKQQRAAEQEVPLCAVVSARDLGAPLELHPQKKSELGARLARIAEKLFY